MKNFLYSIFLLSLLVAFLGTPTDAHTFDCFDCTIPPVEDEKAVDQYHQKYDRRGKNSLHIDINVENYLKHHYN
ncbi:uncharacterized protein CELE_Y75B12B.13 [Caenorhabditis elegans]|uniref:Secreted protein n=1 Tax=Caenorhabditis elegans TaxID=6239 RepID=A5HWA1_CAEEL|nr:Secreted protein [Caenorhabditis elegans]CAN86911.1 Secreted protein [Caenorhabditis elegans]|eukprot:NP_001123068.1 Uncharacterized protein CELE_Y75B12B.13 [Caenorhabditis elegans]